MGGGAIGNPRLLSINFISKKYKNIQTYNKNPMTHYICWGLGDLRLRGRLETTRSHYGDHIFNQIEFHKYLQIMVNPPLRGYLLLFCP